MSEKKFFYPGALDEVDGELIQMGNKCKDCEKTSYPARERCPFCSSENIEKVPLSKEGTIFSYGVTCVPVGPYKPPFAGAYIDLPEGTRLFGQIHGNIDDIKSGLKVKVETGVVWTEKDGTDVYGYYYVPLNAEEGGLK
jgi:uncharacterized OB-fold protein